jgi:hypothetical protein
MYAGNMSGLVFKRVIYMNEKSKPENLLIWYKGLESYIDNPVCLRSSSMPEMREMIQVDVGQYA